MVGHEVVLFGYIHGADTDRLHTLNAAVVADLPVEDEWPFLVRGMFALPERWPLGTYRTRVIHFGASLKDDPHDPTFWDGWLSKFEAVLRRLYWWSAELHLRPESGPNRVYEWLPTTAAINRACGDPPQPVQEWERSVTILPARQAEPGAAADGGA